MATVVNILLREFLETALLSLAYSTYCCCYAAIVCCAVYFKIFAYQQKNGKTPAPTDERNRRTGTHLFYSWFQVYDACQE